MYLMFGIVFMTLYDMTDERWVYYVKMKLEGPSPYMVELERYNDSPRQPPIMH